MDGRVNVPSVETAGTALFNFARLIVGLHERPFGTNLRA
jgi:hypothetical protein